VPTHERLGPDDCESLQDRRKPAIQLDKEPAIMVREPDATMQPAPQDNQLMSKYRVLSFKPQLRFEWRGQGGQSEIEEPDHSASLGDSITSSTRIRFSVHTGKVLAAPSPTSFMPLNISGLKKRSVLRSCIRLSVLYGAAWQAAPPPMPYMIY